LQVWLLAVCASVWLLGDVRGQLFESLQVNANRVPLGNQGRDPGRTSQISPDGPKAIATADFDLDGHADVATADADGTINVLYGAGDGSFDQNLDLYDGAATLRDIITADFDGDERPDIAVTDPYEGKLYIYLNNVTGRGFGSAVATETWVGARNLVAADLDRDNKIDLAVAGHTVGLRQLRGNGDGSFNAVVDLSELAVPAPVGQPYNFRPVYTLKMFTPLGQQPKLAVTHSKTTKLWVLSSPTTTGGAKPFGTLFVESTLFDGSDFHELHDFEIAPITSGLDSLSPDLITVSRDRNSVMVWSGQSSAPYFSESPSQQIAIPGGPRSVDVADTDHDGWGEVAIVVRNHDRTLLFDNQSGTLEERVTLINSLSPRDLVMPDLNGDACADIVVINRQSQDLKVHLTDATSPDGFRVPRQLYSTGGDVAGLALADMNQDGRADVIQLHRAAGDVSIRHARADGSLEDPVFFIMGINSNALTVQDLNDDGIPDVSVANLGRLPAGGNLTIRHGDGNGGLGELHTISSSVPSSTPGELAPGMFALVQADFDGDGIEDQAVGYYDCRVSFFRGLGDGAYELKSTTQFVYESRVMVVGDFDLDGNIDLAGAGAGGEGVILLNHGDLMSDPNSRVPLEFSSGIPSSLQVSDINSDGDLDLVVGSSFGMELLLGAGGATFTSTGLIGGTRSVKSVAEGNFDGESSARDLAVACAESSRLEMYSGDGAGEFQLVLEVAVPSAAFIASGDIDGDGKDDLVGTGSVLWTALSGTTPPPVRLEETTRPALESSVVINEILPKNDSFRLVGDDLRKSDAVELYNATGQEVDLAGWKLRLLTTAGETRDFTVPGSELLPARERSVFVCRAGSSGLHTGYKLPAEGGTLTLFDAGGIVVDKVIYPRLDGDVSLARYGDGNGTFYFNPYPDIGAPNLDNGVSNPEMKFLGVVPHSPAGGEPVKFVVRARDDIGMASLSVYWRFLGTTTLNETGWVPLFDDGAHGDGEMLDGIFAGTLESGFPDGAEIEFYIKGVDLSDSDKVLPDTPMFSAPGLPVRNFSIAVGSASDIGEGLQISEVVATNTGLVVDEGGEAADWIEIRNTGLTTVSLDRFMLSQHTSPDPEKVLHFPPGVFLAPGEYLLVWADDEVEQGQLHAPFKLSAGGETLTLAATTDTGATAIVDAVEWPSLQPGEAFAVLGLPGQSVTRVQRPTPRSQNLFGAVEILEGSDDGILTLAYPTGGAGFGTWFLEVSGSLGEGTWQGVETGNINGIERLHRAPMQPGDRRYYRVRLP